MTTPKPTGEVAERLMATFTQRIEVLRDMLELAQRQRACIDQGKTDRLDRLIRHREGLLAEWQHIEEQLASGVEAARDGTLRDEHKTRLRPMIEESNTLIEAIGREDELAGQEMETQNTDATLQLSTLRTERKTLHAYAKEPPPEGRGGVDRNA